MFSILNRTNVAIDIPIKIEGDTRFILKGHSFASLDF